MNKKESEAKNMDKMGRVPQSLLTKPSRRSLLINISLTIQYFHG